MKGIYENKSQYLYEVITNQINIENKTISTSGIKVYKKGYENKSDKNLSDNFITENYSIIRDISTNRARVENLISYLHSFNVCPMHLKDIVEDFLQAGY